MLTLHSYPLFSQFSSSAVKASGVVMDRSRCISRVVLAVLLGHVLFLSGCATNSYKLMQESEQRVSEQAMFSQVSQQMGAMEKRIAIAQAGGVAMFSPEDMSSALRSLAQARRYYDQFKLEPGKINKSASLFFGDSLGEETLTLLAKASESLNRAEANKRRSDSLLAGSVENFTWLKKFQAQTYYPYAYRDLEQAHKGLIRKVARGRFESAQQALPQLLREQKALEIMSAQRFYLKDISKRVEREGRYSLDRYAALSYSGSLSALNRAKTIIAQNPRNEAVILAAKADAEFSFEVAHAVAGDMKKLVDMNRREMERWLLLLTAKLNETGKALGSSDVRDRSVLSQLELIAKAAHGQSEKLTKADSTVIETEQKLDVTAEGSEALASRVIKLEEERTALGRQVEALAAQMDEVRGVNQQMLAQDKLIVKDEYVPLSQRKSLFW